MTHKSIATPAQGHYHMKERETEEFYLAWVLWLHIINLLQYLIRDVRLIITNIFTPTAERKVEKKKIPYSRCIQLPVKSLLMRGRILTYTILNVCHTWRNTLSCHGNCTLIHSKCHGSIGVARSHNLHMEQ